MMTEILIGIALFTVFVLLLALTVQAARAWLVDARPVTVTINERKYCAATTGDVLLSTLAGNDVHLPSACGGAGTCGLCRVVITEGGREPIPVEGDRIHRADLARGTRLACQVKLQSDTVVTVPEEVFGVASWTCTVRSNTNLTALIKELVLSMPEGEDMDFRAGGFVEVTCPPGKTDFADFDIPATFAGDWNRPDLRRLISRTTRPVKRAYSLANHPGQDGTLVLNVRLALPPPGADSDIPPGIVSSWLFGLKPGDPVLLSGPFGHFFPSDSDTEMIYIGGGAGMAPMRSHIADLLINKKSRRRISFWYGARSLRDIFYAEDFERLATAHENFDWTVALSDPQPDDVWEGETGFIHEVVLRACLADHPAPEDCEYYLCGPPMMVKAVNRMLENLGVEAENIRYDDFGG
jgi:Na+-transporting NADH:ubiquinone oxidoreductase subunit F